MIGEFDTHAFMRRLIQSTILRAATGGGRPPASEIILSVFGRFALVAVGRDPHLAEMKSRCRVYYVYDKKICVHNITKVRNNQLRLCRVSVKSTDVDPAFTMFKVGHASAILPR